MVIMRKSLSGEDLGEDHPIHRIKQIFLLSKMLVVFKEKTK